MNILDVNPKDIIFALDIGTRSIIGNVGVIKDRKFSTICEKYEEHEERAMIDGQIHDINLVASTVNSVKKSIEEEIGIKLEDVSIAAAGRLLKTTEVKVEIEVDSDKEIDREIIRSLELTAVKSAEEEINKQTKGKLYSVGYSVKNYYLNGYVISNLLSQKGEKISAEVIATFLPRSVIDSLYSVINKVGLNVTNLTLEPIAAMEAAIPKKLRLLNIALVDVGAGTSDIAISSNDSISAYGMVPMAGDEITEAIVQNFLVEFNTAEVIKRKTSKGENVKYTDVLGIENEVSPDEVIKIINPIVDKITEEIGTKIIELNGGKAPNAIFLVGGGAHTPNFKEFIAEKLNLPNQRVAIKGRDAVIECTNYNEELGSAGVTVLGIALVSIKKSGHEFIDVILNNEVISLFNSHKHTVMDVMLQAGINHKALIGKNGKNIKFDLNEAKRVAFGSLAKGAVIKVNDKDATIDTEVKEGYKIQINFAKNGQDATPRVIDYVKKINSVSFYFNDVIQNLDTIVFINDKRKDIEDYIKEEDKVRIVFPSTLGEYIKYYKEEDYKYNYYIDDEKINEDYIIKEGDEIYTNIEDDLQEKINNIDILEENTEENIEENIEEKIEEKIEENIQENTEGNIEEKVQENEEEIYNDNINKDYKSIEIVVNDESLVLMGKDEYVFIDIFDYIDFDLTVSKGKLVILLNDKSVGYYDKLTNGDIIKIFWENI